MAITSIKTGSSFTNLTKYDSFLAGNSAFIPNSYESIATSTVGAGGVASVTFSSIPSTYTHLQIRAIMRDARAATQDSFNINMNNDTGSNYGYGYHEIYGDGSTVAAYTATASQTRMSFDRIAGNTASANMFGAFIVDILDYKDTNKYKTARFLSGVDLYGSGAIAFGSGLWLSTAAINRIDIAGANGNISQYSSIALYGIKGS